jgi:hypothetical protein
MNIRSMSMGTPWMPPGTLTSRTAPVDRSATMGGYPDSADVDYIRSGGYSQEDVDAIRYGEPADQGMLEDRYNAVGRSVPPWLESYRSPIVRTNPFGDDESAPALGSGRIVREDPYKTSDENAKRQAYLLGRAHQVEHAAGGNPGFIYPPKPGEDITDPRTERYDVSPVDRDYKPAMDRRRSMAAAEAARDGVEKAQPAQMMDNIGPGKSFQYKPGVPGEDPAKQQYGTTTQDLRKTPMGASMVTVDPQTGLEQIDVREAVGPILASLGNLNMRMRWQEQNRKGGK